MKSFFDGGKALVEIFNLTRVPGSGILKRGVKITNLALLSVRKGKSCYSTRLFGTYQDEDVFRRGDRARGDL